MKLDANQSQIVEGARGGAIAGSVCGALIGYTLGLLLDQADGNSYVNPIVTMLFASGIGAAGLSIIAALSGSAAPKQERKSERALAQEYRVVFTGEESQVNRASEIVRQLQS
jgi:F0F1-type ATP synthase assembly protein I